MNKSETQKYVQELQKENRELKKQASELEEIYKREREVIDNLYRRCSKRAGTAFKDKKYDFLRIVTNEELKLTPEKPEMYDFSIGGIGGEVYIRYSDYEWYRKGKENEIKELESKIKEFESELSVKENLLKTKNGLCKEKPRIHIIGLREFGGEQYMRFSDVEDLINELEG